MCIRWLLLSVKTVCFQNAWASVQLDIETHQYPHNHVSIIAMTLMHWPYVYADLGVPQGYETALQLALHNGHVIIATHAQSPTAPMPADEIDGPG